MRAFAFATCLALLAPTLAHAEEPEMRLESKPLFVSGLVTVGVGFTAMSIGGGMMAFSAMFPKPVPLIDCISPCPAFNPGPDPLLVAGGVVLGVGAAMSLAAIPMIVIGAKRVPIDVEPVGPYGSNGMTLRLTF